MKSLALETSGKTGSVALFDATECVADARLPTTARSAESLIVCIDQLLNRQGWTSPQLDLVAVAQGPGSFTGLRVGCVTAKTFAYAAGAHLVGVDSLQTVAAAAGGTSPVWCAMDAQRGECYVAKFCPAEDLPREIESTHILATDTLLSRLERGDRITGPLLTELLSRLPEDVQAVDKKFWWPQARWVGQLALEKFCRGKRDDIWQFVPNYYRRSSAEEKLAAAQKSSQP
jgi:tRNA threonylcarbamoyladenosine biosynthesis protein TsaB